MHYIEPTDSKPKRIHFFFVVGNPLTFYFFNLISTFLSGKVLYKF